MNVMEESLQKHREWKGKIEVCSRAKVNNAKDLTLAYTPGVAQPCLEIQKDPDLSYALIVVKASCPGVSRKVMSFPLTLTL